MSRAAPRFHVGNQAIDLLTLKFLAGSGRVCGSKPEKRAR